AALAADPAAGATSDGNGVFEPGETAEIRPSWRNAGASSLPLTGAATNLAGPPGGTYSQPDASADYGSIGAGATSDCAASANCYSIAISAASRPQTHWDATFVETPSNGDAAKTWTLHLGDSFTDVPRTELFYKKIETGVHAGITVGCTGTTYCPSDKVARSQMAIFLARAIAGGGANVPTFGFVSGAFYSCDPSGKSLFTDVSRTDPSCKSVHYI